MAKAKVLLVDDSPFVLAMLSALLQSEGYEVITAQDGLTAIELTYTENPDIILLDVMMPKMNGYQVARLLKFEEQTKHIPIIIFTSKDKPIDRFWGLQTGADAYLVKEEEHDKLLKTIELLLKKRPTISHTGISLERPSYLDILIKTNDLLDRKLYEATIINRITELGKKIPEISAAVKGVFKHVEELLPYEIAALFLAEQEKSRFFILTKSKISEEMVQKISKHCKDFLEKEKDMDFPDPEITVFESGSEEIKDSQNTYFALFSSEGGIYTLFFFYGEAVAKLGQSEKEILNLILEHASIILENAYLYEKIRLKSITDELTGLYNRRYFLERLEMEWERAKRYKRPISLLLLDIDYFKKINDTYGHLAGDRVLRTLGKIVSQHMRRSEIAGRYGGEEFAILAPETDAESAVKLGERLRKTIENYSFPINGYINLTISIGVADAIGVNSVTEFIQRADNALYKAKEAGRNRVVKWEEDKKC
ncbi:MAG TPA: diguanylate cyclase [Candidatus Desulfofervidus auxilii]|uniref:diguanylate cyclase n=1 Tax=Desulfofervidus auxilii TaxID=1621989 RepID=A0A7C0U151_DESA2|nr:diguanylate cyclase [Candidatus Desulfofervidus auxilii]